MNIHSGAIYTIYMHKSSLICINGTANYAMPFLKSDQILSVFAVIVDATGRGFVGVFLLSY